MPRIRKPDAIPVARGGGLRPLTLLLCLLLPATLLAAPPQGDKNDKKQTIRPGYTSDQVVKAFEKRYGLAEPKAKPGKVSIEGDDSLFETVSQAVQAAPDGAVISLGPGVYRESIIVTGRKLKLVGAGPDKSLVVATETALFISRSDVTIEGVALWSLSVGADVSVVAISESTVRMVDCRATGGTGPGIIIAGRGSEATLSGNLVTGNMGGGLRVQGGTVRMMRNTVVRNALAGVVMAASVPGAVASFSLWHDTILDNWGGTRCASFLRTGVIPVVPLDLSLEASVLNSTGLADTFSPALAAEIKDGGKNFLSDQPLPAADYFLDPSQDDFRPRAEVRLDALGLELGSLPSPAGMEKLKPLLSNALISEKLQIAYRASLFLPFSKRAEAHEQIKQLLYSWVDDYLKTNRLGARLFAALGLAQVVPPDWRAGVILDKFLTGFADRYTYALKPLNFFADKPQLGDRVIAYLKGRTSLFPRYVVDSTQSPNSYVISGRVEKPMASKAISRPFKLSRTLPNPYFEKAQLATRMLESMKKENLKKIKELEDTLANPHLANKLKENSAYRTSIEKKLASLKEEQARIETQLAELAAQAADTKEQFDIQFSGEIKDTTAAGTVFVTFVAAPSGEILLDATQDVRFTYTSAKVKPLPDFGYEGSELTGVEAESLDELAARTIADMLLYAVIGKETTQLKELLEQFVRGLIDNAAEDKLVELLLLNAPLYEKALAVRPEYEQLKAQAAMQPAGEIDVTLGYNPNQGSNKKGVTIEVRFDDRANLPARLVELETIYRPYWELQPLIDEFLRLRYGLNDKALFQNRQTLNTLLVR
jgi:hypothetical protein